MILCKYNAIILYFKYMLHLNKTISLKCAMFIIIDISQLIGNKPCVIYFKLGNISMMMPVNPKVNFG